MDPYAQCWCLSGKKWKWCHKDRDRQTAVNSYELVEELNAAYMRGHCSHPAASKQTCSEAIVRSHTVQRRGGLAAIAEDGHVVSAKAGYKNIFKNNGEIIPQREGVKSASTFMGFCGHHDTTMFRSVETGLVSLTHEAAFLLSFRAVAYEVFQKRAALESSMRTDRDADKGKPFEAQCAIQEHRHFYQEGLRRGVAEIERWKAEYDSTYLNLDYSRFAFYAVAFEGVLPVVACGCIYPEFDFAGRRLQIISRGQEQLEHVTFNMTVLDERTIVVFSWRKGEIGPARVFADSYAEIPVNEKAEAVVRFAFAQFENICMKPSWWYGLSSEQRDAAIYRIKTGTGMFGPERLASDLLPDGRTYVGPIVIAETVTSR